VAFILSLRWVFNRFYVTVVGGVFVRFRAPLHPPNSSAAHYWLALSYLCDAQIVEQIVIYSSFMASTRRTSALIANGSKGSAPEFVGVQFVHEIEFPSNLALLISIRRGSLLHIILALSRLEAIFELLL
jgi:hypothetical protein